LLTPHDGHVDAADYRKLTGKKTRKYSVARFQVLMAASIKTRAFWDIAPCSLVGIYGRSRGAYCHHHPEEILERQKMKKKMKFRVFWDIRRYIPEDFKLHTRRRENLKSQIKNSCAGVAVNVVSAKLETNHGRRMASCLFRRGHCRNLGHNFEKLSWVRVL
jgi:hypothetical protein